MARAETRVSQEELEAELTAESSTLALVLQRRLDLIERLINLAATQIELSLLLELPAATTEAMRQQLDVLQQRTVEQTERLTQIIEEARLDTLPEIDRVLESIQADALELTESIDRQNGTIQLSAEQELELTLSQVDTLLEQSQIQAEAVQSGLVPIELDMDEGMLTALVQRFELMNERGFLADDWRQIKLAADDLRSVLTLTANQSIRTRDDVNRVFDFTWD